MIVNKFDNVSLF